jgi:putative chitinase
MNISKLIGHIPNPVLVELTEICGRLNLSREQLSNFLAQCSHESGRFMVVFENLNYNQAGLLRVFPKYFDESRAKQYARNPQMIGNRVYASRMGNGNEASGDGFRFRGRGFIQLTGRSNYALFDREVPEDIIANPDLVANKYPLRSAEWFFSRNKIWDIATKVDRATITTVSRRVNGGLIGLQDRIDKTNHYWNILK